MSIIDGKKRLRKYVCDRFSIQIQLISFFLFSRSRLFSITICCTNMCSMSLMCDVIACSIRNVMQILMAVMWRRKSRRCLFIVWMLIIFTNLEKSFFWKSSNETKFQFKRQFWNKLSTKISAKNQNIQDIKIKNNFAFFMNFSIIIQSFLSHFLCL